MQYLAVGHSAGKRAQPRLAVYSVPAAVAVRDHVEREPGAHAAGYRLRIEVVVAGHVEHSDPIGHRGYRRIVNDELALLRMRDESPRRPAPALPDLVALEVRRQRRRRRPRKLEILLLRHRRDKSADAARSAYRCGRRGGRRAVV